MSMKTSESILKISAALVKAQSNMGSASKDAKNPFFKTNYADFGSVLAVAKPALNDEGIAILQQSYSKDGADYVETTLLHESGEYMTTDPLKLKLLKEDMQSLGSALSYAKRQSLQSLLTIPAKDDDGESSSKQETTTKPTFRKDFGR